MKTNHSFPPEENYRNKISKTQIENYVWKRKPKMIKICAFKEKEKEGGEGRPQLSGLWKVLMLGGP